MKPSAGVSGGSWFVALFTERGTESEISLSDFVSHLGTIYYLVVSPRRPLDFPLFAANSASKYPFLIDPSTTSSLWTAMSRLRAFSANRSVAMADVFGSLLAMQWLRAWAPDQPINRYSSYSFRLQTEFVTPSSRLDFKLTDQQAILESCDYDRPLPIYNAVHPNENLTGSYYGSFVISTILILFYIALAAKYEWVEFTPWEVRQLDSGVAVPTWAFGRRFVEGIFYLLVYE